MQAMQLATAPPTAPPRAYSVKQLTPCRSPRCACRPNFPVSLPPDAWDNIAGVLAQRAHTGIGPPAPTPTAPELSLASHLRRFRHIAMHAAATRLAVLGGWRSLCCTPKPSAHVLASHEPYPGLILDLIMEVIPSPWHPHDRPTINLVLTAFAHRPGPGTMYTRRLETDAPMGFATRVQLDLAMREMQATVLHSACGAPWLHATHRVVCDATHALTSALSPADAAVLLVELFLLPITVQWSLAQQACAPAAK